MITCSISEIFKFGPDFGVYYAGAKFIDSEYQLYDQFFDHKGPFYYFFLKMVGNIIGWGLPQAIFSYFLGLSFFYFPILFLIFQKDINKLTKICLSLTSTSILIGQSSNSAISFFQQGLIIISMIFLFNSKKYTSFSISLIFIWLAIYTRIDSIIYLPIFFIELIRNKLKRNYFEMFLNIIYMIIIPIFIFLFFSFYFGFSFEEYWIHNVHFNSWYKEINYDDNFIVTLAKLILRPNALKFSVTTLIFPSIIYIIYKKKFTFLKSKLNIINYKKLINNFIKNDFSWFLIIIPPLSYLYTLSDKNYYSLIFLCPALLFTIFHIDKILDYKKEVSITFFTFLLVLNISFLQQNIKFLLTTNLNPPFEETIEFININKVANPEFVGGEGWPYLLIDNKPIRAVNDNWLYAYDKEFLTKSLSIQHENLLSMPSGYKFWINNGLLKNSKNNELLKSILKISSLKIDQKYFSLFEIN